MTAKIVSLGAGSVPSQEPSTGGDLPGIATTMGHSGGPRMGWAIVIFLLMCLFALVAGAVDIAFLKQVLTARFSDEFGIAKEGTEAWVWLASLGTVAYFFVIGRAYHAGGRKRYVALAMYGAILIFIALSLQSTFGQDIALFLSSVNQGWRTGATEADGGWLAVLKIVLLLMVAMAFTGPGLAFAFFERKAELAFVDMQEQHLQFAEARRVRETYQAAKEQADTAADEEINRRQTNELFSDDASVTALIESMKVGSTQLAEKVLSERLAALPQKSARMTRSEQDGLDAERKDIEDRIARLKDNKATINH
jgi:hypothetical protein